MKTKNMLVPIVLAASLCSCGTMGSFRPHDSYVRADRETFNALAPVIRGLATPDPADDPDLTGVNGVAVLSLVDSWELRLEKAEESLR